MCVIYVILAHTVDIITTLGFLDFFNSIEVNKVESRLAQWDSWNKYKKMMRIIKVIVWDVKYILKGKWQDRSVATSFQLEHYP